MTNVNPEFFYPNIGKRIKAVLIDSVLFVLIIMTILPIIGEFEFEQTWIKICIILLPFFILDPLLVSLSGGSIGHHVLKIRIQNAKTHKNLNLVFASIRFFVKTTLGSLSLIFILFTNKHQAFHDLITNSTVVMKNSDEIYPHNGLRERNIKEEGYLYPSKTRRFMIIIFYNIFIFTSICVLSFLFLSEPCIEYDQCSQKDDIISTALSLSWIIFTISVIYFGINSKLHGCRRKKIQDV